MKLYGFIVSTSRVLANGYTRTTHSPTMWLDPNVQGILSAERAAVIALHMAREIAGDPQVRVWVTAWANDASNDMHTAGDDPMREVR